MASILLGVMRFSCDAFRQKGILLPRSEPGIEAKGFKKLVIPGLALAAGDRLRENENMEPGNVEETVEVTAAAPLLQTDSSTVQSTVSAAPVAANGP